MRMHRRSSPHPRRAELIGRTAPKPHAPRVTLSKPTKPPGWPFKNSITEAYFLHIPRTGGFSLYYLFGQCNWVHWWNNGHAHFRRPPIIEGVEHDVPIFTFLRDPVAHSVSIYKYHRTHSAMGEAYTLAANNTFSDWLRKTPSVGGFWQQLGRNPEAALTNLRSMAFVGLTEQLTEHVNEMLKQFGVGQTYDGRIVNAVTSVQVRPTPDDIDFIKKVRADDYPLVAEVKKIRG